MDKEKELISIPPIELVWSEWFPWDEIKADARGNGVKVPNKESGGYEAKHVSHEERLTIGKASDLRMRIKQGLVRGTIPHSSGKKIRENEETHSIIIRWAVTDRPSAIEEELHKRRLNEFGRSPKYVAHT